MFKILKTSYVKIKNYFNSFNEWDPISLQDVDPDSEYYDEEDDDITYPEDFSYGGKN